MKKLYYLYLEIKNLLFPSNSPIPKILSIDETIDLIIKNKLSAARFGDGEFSLLLDIDNPDFQERNLELKNKLLETIHSNLPSLLICIPKFFEKSDLKTKNKRAAQFWHHYMLKNKKKINELLDINKICGNSVFTRNYLTNINKENTILYFNKIKGIWDNRDIIIIEGQYTRFGVNNDLLNNVKSAKRILCPEKNAFNKYTDILKEALKHNKNCLFLLALGPTATVLAYDLCKNGYQAIDIGHLDIEYEWFLRKATTKIAIPNKYINEGNHIITKDNDTLNNSKYKNEILKTIL